MSKLLAGCMFKLPMLNGYLLELFKRTDNRLSVRVTDTYGGINGDTLVERDAINLRDALNELYPINKPALGLIGSKTLSLNRRAHLFVRDGALFIKLQTPHNKMPDKADIYILKKFSIDRLKDIRDWADAMIQASESSNVKKD